MNILLTGGTGFTGRALMPMLEESGYHVYNVTREKKGVDREIVWDFFSDFTGELPGCDVIVHLAAYPYFGPELLPDQYIVNTLSTTKLAAYAVRHNAYFVLASMSGIHQKGIEFIHENSPIVPPNHYAMSKFLAEQVVRAFASQYSILRIAGIYGAQGPSHLGLNTSITNALYKKEIPVLFGPGTAKRNYISVTDVARWISYLVANHQKHRNRQIRTVKEILYLAGSETMTIEHYLEMITKVLLEESRIIRMEGSDSPDIVVQPSPFPFKPLSFEDYLKSIL